MAFRTLDAANPEDRDAWLRLWQSWPEREPMAHPAYARLFARPKDRAVALAWEEPGGAILFPLILRPLAAEPWAGPAETAWDATSPYGYGGPFAWGKRDDAAFWREQARWRRAEGVVSTFARLSLFPEQLAALPEPAADNAVNVVVPLGGGEDALWNGYEAKVRKNVKTAQRAGLSVEIDEDGHRLDEFLAIYAHTMERRDAEDWYSFPRGFFETFVRELPGSFAFAHVLSPAGKVVSTELLLCSRDNAYSFLGGTLSESFAQRPGDLLKHRAALWAAERGKKSYVLGGGYSAGDGIFRYKRAFAPRGEVVFKVLRLIHDEAAVGRLSAAREASEKARGRGWTPRPDYFPPYRA